MTATKKKPESFGGKWCSPPMYMCYMLSLLFLFLNLAQLFSYPSVPHFFLSPSSCYLLSCLLLPFQLPLSVPSHLFSIVLHTMCVVTMQGC